jgi:hypothetical protein
MGARAQVLIKDEGVYLYTHWGSGELIDDVKRALASQAGRNRWGDPEYLARIIFNVMQGYEHASEFGFGISTTRHGDLDYMPIVVDCANQTVTIDDVKQSFADFVA